ncbi:MAG: hypothetical protein A2X13_01910 [Bacteroidetes bacterium GWC2_33_15]|nr:MAG: hypothetical protein A2X10_07715 [Bacteroidetes bacterium GWA2_33_15]OFX52235.1 MAG: hypothetical protein A2X13_01910 [Bacteroidetes bacterium GWC2_33_15]OFX64389.1 MAG: hypothetical protein A2X15_12730 [Bacteroidetes bacterium GWB2_32_14]OFX67794.1 MAG: hypothetical protein A2X14_06555 [Bacteroidetes bacterium GWD2_33_33]HAN19406.1 hypothetical protein [Bacteroidales bacterium]
MLKRNTEHISVEILSDIFQNSSIVALKLNTKGEIIFANHYFEVLFGFKEYDVIGKNLFETIVSVNDNKPNHFINFYKYLNKPGIYTFEEENTDIDGKKLWISWQINPDYQSNTRKHGGFILIGQDITDRKKIETRLIENEKKLSDFLNLLPELVFEIDTNLKITFINQSCIHFLGYSKEEILSNKVTLKDIIRPEDLVRLNKSIISNFNGNHVSGNNYGIIHKNGNLIHTQFHNNPVWENNKITKLRCIAVDITEKYQFQERLQEQEKKFRLIYENSPIPYQSLNIKGEIIEVNPSWLATLGYSRDEVIGSYFSHFIIPSQKEQFEKNFENFKISGEAKDIRFEMIRKNGTKLYVNFNGKIEKDENGSFISTHCVFNDITLQQKAEKTIIQSELKLRELNATKDKFFSIIAHDLKNPFNEIIGFSYLLATNIYKYDLARVEQFANIIHQSSKLTFNLLENLLDWSRSQTGNLKFNPAAFSLKTLVKEIIELFESQAANKNIVIYNEVDDSNPVFADKNMISTVIRNLISNAIKYTNQGGFVRINNTCNHNFVTVNVIDNGVGMNYEDQGKLFRLDVNISRAGTEKERGTGLGLILCKEFVERNGGNIQFESEPGKGSRYFFTIPIAQPDEELNET